jgi:pimeloyl-[acyl-carrier protein] methyl ester esterase
MTRVVLVHGWGYDASLWDAVRSALDPALQVETVDLGFFGAEQKVGADRTGIDLAVGHSLGVLWWLTQAAPPWKRLLSINGFPRFTETADYAPAVAPRVLARMKQQLLRDPKAVLADFHARCGDYVPAGIPDTIRLAAGLDWLAAWDGRTVLAARRDDVFVLAGSDDPIVPAAMSTMAFSGQCEQVAAPGHLLPVTHPELCARRIAELAA